METKNQTAEEALIAQQQVNKQSINSGIAHRMEVVWETEGKTWINDSKSSCLESALYSLEEIQSELVWIMGADQEDFDYATFKEFLPLNVKHILLFGEKQGQWEKVFQELGLNFDYSRSLEQVVQKAKDINVGVVIFAPATSGFEDYRNFRTRGEHFKSLVLNLEQ